jgi:SAM-dependent methyltransferase
MSNVRIYKSVVNVVKRRLLRGGEENCFSYLDIGAGRGELIERINSELNVHAYACDYHIERFKYLNATIDKINLNTDILPYQDGLFDLVTCSEVIEHLENYRQVVREIYRVLKPGGICVLTTPNILNMNSRLRFFSSGFYNLFGPLPFKNDKLYSTGGHINPISYFYLAHALVDAGFTSIELDIDKRQRSSSVYSIILYLPLLLGWLLFLKKEIYRFKTITDVNREHVTKHFKWNILTGRTVIISGAK